MRIGLITHNYPASSTDRQNAGIFVYDLAQALRKLNQEVFVLCLRSQDQVRKEEIPVVWFDWMGKGKKLGDLKLYNPFDLFLFFNLLYTGSKAAAKFSKDNKIDFLIGMWAFPAGIFALWANLRQKVPFALWALGSDIYIYARYPLLGSIIKMALKKAKFLVADGIDLAKQTAKLAQNTCEFLPSASHMPSGSKLVRKKGGPLKFMFLGRMEPVKGPDVLVDAFLKIGNLDFELHCLGDGSLLPVLKQQVKDCGLEKKVFFYGNVNDSKIIYSRLISCDWLVIPSRSDSIPLVFSESMKAKLPVIVSEVGDMVELVKKYEVGHSFPKEDSNKLADILKTLITEGRAAIKPYQENTFKAAAIFDVAISAKKLLGIIQAAARHSLGTVIN